MLNDHVLPFASGIMVDSPLSVRPIFPTAECVDDLILCKKDQMSQIEQNIL